jgi:hypothetical protein
MSDASPSTESTPQAAAKRRVRWDALAAIIASLVGLLALIVAGYTAYIQRQQVRAQVWPHLILGHSNALGQYELTALNQGVGPAIIESVEVRVAGKPVADWKALAAMLEFQPKSHWVASTLNGMVLTPSEHLHWIRFDNADDINAFTAAWKRFHVEARVCYSSALGEHWTTMFVPGSLNRTQPVANCPEVDAAQRFVD